MEIADLEKAASIIEAGRKADRRSYTGDGSLLLEYFKHEVRGGVDIYPSGEINAIIEEDGVDCIYEFDMTELGAVAKLVRTGKYEL